MPGGRLQCLKLCLHTARPSARPQWRSSSTKAKELIGEDLGPIHCHGHQTFRVRKDGKKLPLPPLLDPVVLEERTRWETPKQRPRVDKFTPFQRKLWESPYAHALASPPRQCRGTNILLPASLLISLHPRPHPTTNDPWLLPVSLTTSKTQLGPPYRFLGQRHVAVQLGKKKAWERGIHIRFTQKLGKQVGKMVWREDMPDLILELLRKRVAGKLTWWFSWRGRLVHCQSPRTEDIEDIDDISCVLYFGSLKTRADEIQAQATRIADENEKWANYFAKGYKDKLDPHASPDVTHSSPSWYTDPLVPRLQARSSFPELEFKTTVWRGRKVAVYSLPDLLGEEKAKGLIQGSYLEGERCVVMKRRRQNVPMEILLMQIEAYLARPGP